LLLLLGWIIMIKKTLPKEKENSLFLI